MNRDVNTIDWAAVLIRAAKGTASAARPKERIVNGVAAELPAIFTKYEITTARRQAHFIAQAIIECDHFQTLEEYASGDAYDTRTDLGFTAARDGDGRTNKGFGIFQNTGPYNQARALKALQKMGFAVTQDVAQAKSVLTVPKYAAWGAGIFWSDNRMNAIADRDADGTLCSRQVNRGNANAKKPANHEADRKRAFKAAWKELQNPRLLRATIESAGAVALNLKTGGIVDPAYPIGGEDFQPIDRTGMSEPQLAVLDAANARLAASPADLDAEPILGQAGSALNQGLAVPGQDPEEHAEQVAAGEIPKAGPASPNTPLPAEPVAPGTPQGLLRATQERLRDRGFYGVGTPDGEADYKTVGALSGFQSVVGLPVTGQLDQATMNAIWSPDAPQAPVSLARAMTTVKDLEGKSEIIDSAAKVKVASIWQLAGGGIISAGTAVVSGFSETWDSFAGIREVFNGIPGWGWGIIALAVVGVPAVYSYVKANKVQAARVADQQSGKTA